MTLASGNGISIVPVALDHAAMLAALVERNVDHLREFLPAAASAASPDVARAFCEAAVTAAQRGEMLSWHLFAGGALCGSVRVKRIDAGNRKAEIGYFIGRDFAGKGIASSAVRTVLAYCFDSLRLNRIELRCATTNAGSIRVAERLGFTREGLLRQEEYLHGVFVDHLAYGLLREEFGR